MNRTRPNRAGLDDGSGDGGLLAWRLAGLLGVLVLFHLARFSFLLSPPPLSVFSPLFPFFATQVLAVSQVERFSPPSSSPPLRRLLRFLPSATPSPTSSTCPPCSPVASPPLPQRRPPFRRRPAPSCRTTSQQGHPSCRPTQPGRSWTDCECSLEIPLTQQRILTRLLPVPGPSTNSRATPHASAYHYRPTPTRATTLPTGLGFHLDEPTSTVASLPPVGSAAAQDLFSPSIYSTNSPDSSNLHPSPSTDSLPSPPSPGMDNLQVQEPLAWSDGPEWRDDVNYDSPVWTSRWGSRQDSTVSDSLWGTSGDGNGFAGSLAAPAGPVRRSSTGSTHSNTGGFLPVPLRRHNGGRLSDTSSNKSSLFRFSGIPFDPVTISDSTSSLEGDGWDDISNAISDEVHNNGVSGGFAFATHRSGSRVSDRSYDSAFQFDGPSRRPSTDSNFAHPPIMFGRQRAPLPSSFLPVPANAGAELLNRRGSTGGFSDYQIRRASYERRASGGHHPLVTSVDPLWTPEAEEHEPTFDRRESTGSEMERINKLNFLVELQRRASQVVQIGPEERHQAIDQWQADRDAVVRTNLMTSAAPEG